MRYLISAKLQKNFEVDKMLCLIAYDEKEFLSQKYEVIRCKKATERMVALGGVGISLRMG